MRNNYRDTNDNSFKLRSELPHQSDSGRRGSAGKRSGRCLPTTPRAWQLFLPRERLFHGFSPRRFFFFSPFRLRRSRRARGRFGLCSNEIGIAHENSLRPFLGDTDSSGRNMSWIRIAIACGEQIDDSVTTEENSVLKASQRESQLRRQQRSDVFLYDAPFALIVCS